MPRGRYCMYLRKSRADMEEERRGVGETLSRHKHMLMDLARRFGVTISEEAIYREIVSGDTVAERPEVQRLLRDVENRRWDGVFAADVDRLARGDTMDQGLIAQTFLYTHTLIISPYKIYDPDDPSDREFFEMKLFFARREYDQIKRRLQSGRVNAVKEGLYAGSRPVYGYERYKLPERKGWSLRPIPEQAAVVRAIYEWYVRGMGGRDAGALVIANRLNEMGLRTNRGCEWTDSGVIRLLKNPAYIGKVRWNQRVQVTQMREGVKTKRREPGGEPLIVQGIHEPLIDEATWRRAQEMILARRKAPVHAQRPVANPFAGLVKCAVCGRAVIRQINPRCPERDLLKCSNGSCDCRGIYLAAFEQAVLQALGEWKLCLDGERISISSPSVGQPPQDGLIAALERRRAVLKRQLSGLRDLLEQGIYAPDVYLERQQDIQTRMAEADEALRHLSEQREPPEAEQCAPSKRPDVHSISELIQLPLSAGEKNAILRAVIGRIDYQKLEKTPRNANPLAYLTIDVYPILPLDG